MLDIAAPTVIMGQGIGRWGNFMNQEAFGRVTSLSFLQGLHLPDWLINQMYIRGAYRQPTFLYESVWDLLGFALLMLTRHRTHWYKQGDVFLTYVAWYALVASSQKGCGLTRSCYLTLFGSHKRCQWYCSLVALA